MYGKTNLKFIGQCW